MKIEGMSAVVTGSASVLGRLAGCVLLAAHTTENPMLNGEPIRMPPR